MEPERSGGADLVPPDPRLVGCWRRSLLTTSAGGRDTTTQVTWLQGGRLYVDLRLPAVRPDLSGVVCARDLTAGQLAALTRVAGFAGRLVADGPLARWERLVDLQPATGHPDAGSLVQHGDLVVETGQDGSYVEHWHQTAATPAPVAGVLLRETTSGAAAVLLRVGDVAGWARGHDHPLPPGTDLSALVAATTTRGARDLLDAEVAIGRPDPAGIVVVRSSRPWRAGRRLSPTARTGHLELDDEDTDGTVVRRRWQIVEQEGDLADLPVTLA